MTCCVSCRYSNQIFQSAWTQLHFRKVPLFLARTRRYLGIKVSDMRNPWKKDIFTLINVVKCRFLLIQCCLRASERLCYKNYKHKLNCVFFFYTDLLLHALENIEIRGKQINCFPRDQSLSISCKHNSSLQLSFLEGGETLPSPPTHVKRTA